MRRRSLLHGGAAWLYATTAAGIPVPVRRAAAGGTGGGAAWDVAPPGYARVFHDDFTPVEGRRRGYVAWQGIDRSKWKVKGEVFAAEDGHKADPAKNYMSTEHAMATAERGLLLYGGRRADRAGAGWPLSNADRRKSAVATRQPVVAPPPPGSGPLVVRTRTAWELLPYYTKHLWTFADWTDYTVGARTFQKTLEIDLETGPADYSATPPRRVKAHWNVHIWHSIKIAGPFWNTQASCFHKATSVIALPDDPLAPLTIELRVARGTDFYDPTQTYIEWWVENVGTGRLERHYHVSPRSDLEARRGQANWGFDAGVPAREPLPPALAAVAPKPATRPNWFRNDAPKTGAPALLGLPDLAAVATDATWGPYYDLGKGTPKPYTSVEDPSRTWLDEWDEVFNTNTASRFILHGGFQGSRYFLQPDGRPVLADYRGHPTHLDEVRAFASPIRGVAVFEPR